MAQIVARRPLKGASWAGLRAVQCHLTRSLDLDGIPQLALERILREVSPQSMPAILGVAMQGCAPDADSLGSLLARMRGGPQEQSNAGDESGAPGEHQQ